MTSIWDEKKTIRFRKCLLDWYRQHKRVLPWRSDPTPYRVWISEIMLQQTRVQTVLPYYDRFLARFPDVASLAAAPVEEVVAAWAGLGYYSRARNLHEAARKIVTTRNGGFPLTLEEWLALPGIGRYTAGAILSIASNQPHPIVDGNIRRVIARLHALRMRPGETFFWEQASAWVPRERPSEFNQAMMELGALLCAPSAPRCEACPARCLCASYRLGIQDDVPAPRIWRAPESVQLVMLAIFRRGSVLVSDAMPAPYIPGPCALPGRILRPGETPKRAAVSLAKEIKLPEISLAEIRQAKHSITSHRILAHVFSAQTARKFTPGRRSGLRWVKVDESARFLTSSLFRKAIGGEFHK